MLGESGSYSKFPRCSWHTWDGMRWTYLAFEPVLLILSIYIFISICSKYIIGLKFCQLIQWKALLSSKMLCKILVLAVFPRCISLWSQASVSASSFIQSLCGNQCTLPLWQLCSLCRIISLLQAVVIVWIFKLFWQKESLPAQRERWKWTPHCAETWTPWHFLHSMVQLPPPRHVHSELNGLCSPWPGPYELHPLLSWCHIYSSKSCIWLFSSTTLKV